MWYIDTTEYYSAIKKNKIMLFAATWIELETLILSELSQKENNIPYDITYIWNPMYGTNESFHRKESHGLEEQTCGCQGEGKGVGWIGSLGLIDANYCFCNGLTMRSCCVALGTMSGHLSWSVIMWEERIYTCMCDWVTLLCSRKLTDHCKPDKMEKKKT